MSTSRLDGSPFDAGEFTALWLLSALTYGAGDVLTTLTLHYRSTAVVEGNPLVRHALTTLGPTGPVLIKLAVIVGCLAVSIRAVGIGDRGDPVLYYAPPVALALVGTFATAYNLRLLIG